MKGYLTLRHKPSGEFTTQYGILNVQKAVQSAFLILKMKLFLSGIEEFQPSDIECEYNMGDESNHPALIQLSECIGEENVQDPDNH